MYFIVKHHELALPNLPPPLRPFVFGLELELQEGTPTLDKMQELVGGHVGVTQLWRFKSGRALDVWYHDEFLSFYPASPTIVLLHTHKVPLFLHGPLIITAAGTEGETVPMTPAEAKEIGVRADELWPHPELGVRVPILEIESQKRHMRDIQRRN